MSSHEGSMHSDPPLHMFWPWPLFHKVGSPCLQSYFLKYIQVDPVHSAQSLKTQQLGIWDLWLWSLHFHLLTFASPSLSTPWSSIDLAPWNAYGKLVRWHDVLLSKWLNHLDLIKQQVDYEGQENHLGWGKEVAECRINVVTQCLGTLHEDYDLSVCHL